jgi:single-strand DNA-binding protein
MASLNKVLLIGNLGRDPEIKYAQSGTAICNLRIACTEKLKDKEERTEWVDVVCFGKTAESVANFTSKGQSVYVEGRMQTREYEKDGVKRKATEVVADRVQFLGGKGQGDARARAIATPGPREAEDEALPF